MRGDSMDELYFEELKQEDLRAVYELCMKSLGEDFPYDEVAEVYEKCRSDPHYHMIVGKIGGKPVAYTTMVIFHNIFDADNPTAMLWYVCVDEGYRRQGIGKKLFERLESIAEEHHCECLYLTCFKNNTGAQEFYRALGYDGESEKVFVKYIDEKR